MNDNFISLRLNKSDKEFLIGRDIDEEIAGTSFSINITIDSENIELDWEPALDFIKEYYTALVNCVVFGIPSRCSFFSGDIALEFVKMPKRVEIIQVKLLLAGSAKASTETTGDILADIFRGGISKIVDLLKAKFPYEVVANALSSSMIPLNEGYLPTFLSNSVKQGTPD